MRFRSANGTGPRVKRDFLINMRLIITLLL